jgi:hypothetical protein
MFQNNLLMAAASISAGGLTVDNSVRYNDDDSPRLFRTPSVAGNRMTGSISLWYKRCNLGSIQQLYNAGAGDDITFNASDQLTFTDSSGVSYITTQVFRDPTAWGHLLFSWNTTLATAGDRLRIYHNGVEITAFATETNPDQNDQFEISNTVRQTIGANESDTEEFDGYLSQFYYVDGTQLTPTSFGEFDSNNVWRPIEYATGTVGSAATVSFTESDTSSADATAYTFSGVAIGTASATRKVVVAACTNGAANVSTLTIGGASASFVAVGVIAGEPVNRIELWQADIASGTTADIIVTWADSTSRCGIGVWDVNGASDFIYDVGSSEADPATVTMQVPAGGICIGGVFTGDSDTSWTGLTEDYDDQIEAANYMTGASAAFASRQTDLTVTAADGTDYNVLVCAAWGPVDTSYGTNGFFLDFADSSLLGLDAVVAASTTTYRYLKIDVTEIASTSYLALQEMEYYVGATLYPTQTMTSNTAPSPLVASANSDNVGNEAYFAFNDVLTGADWLTANTVVTGYLKIDLGSGNGIAPTSFRLGAPETPDRTPNDFTIQGSNNDSDWTILATYAGVATPTPSARTFLGYCPMTTGNNFISSGLAVADQVNDTPTTNYPTINILAAYDNNHTYSNGDLELIDTNNSTNDTSRVSTIAIPSSGTWGAQMTCVNALNGHSFGVGDQYTVTGDVQGFNQSGVHGVWYNQLGKVFINGSEDTSGKATLTTAGDIIECHVDMDAGDVEFFVNNVSQGSYALPSGYDDGGIDLFYYSDTGILNNTLSFDFGQLGYDPATNLAGSKRLSTANLATPTIKDGTANFQTTLYTGNGSVRNIDQTENSTFQPDFVWLKNRSQADSHMLIDAPRGVTKEIHSDTAAIQTTDANGLTSFDSDGFGLGSGAGGYNDNTESFVAWQWLAGGGAGSSNTAGSINTTTTTVNTTSGFSCSTYDGDDTAGATIGHGLGVIPQMILIKHIEDTAHNWVVYHSGIFGATDPETDYLVLDLTQSAYDQTNIFNDTAPTSSVFSLGSSAAVNATGSGFVAYAFADVEGFSNFDSYKGNGDADGPMIYTGFKPAYVMIKNSTGTGAWSIYDSQRSPYNEIDDQLQANAATAETTGSEEIDFLANGFKIRTADSDVNTSSSYYVYAAFAEYPFGGDGVTPATTF